MRKIAIYGKGGIGKSTIVGNLSSALAKNGHKVMQIGCDPKSDSTSSLLNGREIPAILEVMRDGKKNIDLEDIVFEGSYGVLCAECGGPRPGLGCAGRGVIAAFEKLDSLKAFEVYKPDVVFYDVLGDVVCGGFAMPLRAGYADEVYIVTSGEKMSLFAARNIVSAVREFSSRGYARLRGLILNSRDIVDEVLLVEKEASEMGTRIIMSIPRDPIVQSCEDINTTVVHGAPDSELARTFSQLGRMMLDQGK
jgi:nitrogenase iron protein NifH